MRLGLLFVLLAIGLLLVNVKPAWALTISPNPPMTGQSFTISGTCIGIPPGTGGCEMSVFSGFGCSGIPVLSPGGAIPSGPYVITVPGQSAGQYSVFNAGESSGCVNFTIIPAVTTTTTSTPPIPEYPLGLTLLAILMLLAYEVIRRRTRN